MRYVKFDLRFQYPAEWWKEGSKWKSVVASIRLWFSHVKYRRWT